MLRYGVMRWSARLIAGLVLSVLSVPFSNLSADCSLPSTWSGWARLYCGMSSIAAIGIIQTQTACSVYSRPRYRYTMRPSRIFKGTLESDELEFYTAAPDSADSLLAGDSDVGQTWLLFGKAQPGSAPPGKLYGVFCIRVDVDSVRYQGLPPELTPPPVVPSVLIDTVAATSRCTSGRADSLRQGGR
jgi:hypothetical protein